MISITDSAHLRAEQYQDAANVGRRFDLHKRFSINPYGWHRWVFDQLEAPDRARAFRDIKRVLRLGGTLYAASNGPGHLRKLFDLVLQFDPDRAADGRGGEGFGLVNGGDQLAKHFADVSLARYEDGLIITELDGLLGWAKSWAPAAYAPERLAELYAFLTNQFQAQAPLRVTKDSGIFTARNPR